MASLQINDVPEETHRVLRRRATDAHQSLQEYLRSHLIAEANQPTVAEVLERARGHTGGSVCFDDVVAIVRDDRDRH